MDADYGVELGPEAPALEIPWIDLEGGRQYVDLRTSDAIEHDIELISEVHDLPALRRFIVELNSQRSMWQTAKCDVWSETDCLGGNPYDREFLRGCYVDVALAEAETEPRESLEFHRRYAQQFARLMEENDAIEASTEIVVRRCYFHISAGGSTLEESDAGYCLTVFITGYGASAEEAANQWDRALEFAAECFLRLSLQ
jgi:hypothetical protein